MKTRVFKYVQKKNEDRLPRMLWMQKKGKERMVDRIKYGHRIRRSKKEIFCKNKIDGTRPNNTLMLFDSNLLIQNLNFGI